MKTAGMLVLFLMGWGMAAAQAATAQELPREPHAIFEAAESHYHFDDAAMKPWHLKATYQLYDDKGAPAEKGVWEYWWASPAVYRSSWTRAGATRTEWHTADGKHAVTASGDPLHYFEYRVPAALLEPLPPLDELKDDKVWLRRQDVAMGALRLPCIMVVPKPPQPGHIDTSPLGLFPTYCFDPHLPALLLNTSFGTVNTRFDKIGELRGHFLAREINMTDSGRSLLTVTVEGVNGIAAGDAALTPPAGARLETDEKPVSLTPIAAEKMVAKRVDPAYPEDAKQAEVSGRVILAATIGTDGTVRDLRVVQAPAPSLAAAALEAVAQWQYKPYLVNGQAVEVETAVNVTFSLGGAIPAAVVVRR